MTAYTDDDVWRLEVALSREPRLSTREILDAVAPAIIDRLYQQISDTAYAWGYEEFSDFLAGRYNGV